MMKKEAELEQEAETLQKKAKVEAANKNYDLAILLLTDAVDIYKQLGFHGQIGMLNRQIERFKKIQESEKQTSKSPNDIAEKRTLESEGNKLLDKAKNFDTSRKLKEALEAYLEAKEIFEKLSFNFQVKKINWQVEKIQNKLKAEEIGSSDSLLEQKKDSIAEKRDQRVQAQMKSTQKKYELESVDNMRAQQQKKTALEERRERLKQLGEEKKKKEEQETEAWLKSHEQYEKQRQKEIEERKQKLRLIEEQKKKEEELVTKADAALAKGKECVTSKEFQEAKNHYNEVITIFESIGWAQQAQILKGELRNIDKYEEEYKQRLKDDFIKKKRQEKEFQERVDMILAEKKRKEEARMAQLRALPPELQKNLEKAKMVLERAEKEIEASKIERAIGRYEYVIELYRTIPSDKMDLTNDINEIEKKISELKLKL